ncbi:MAG: PQQ-binding-like beta-propeller repeat protein [Bacteroidales bacterium]
MKKVVIGGVFALVILGLLALIVGKRFEHTDVAEVIEAVPSDAVLLVEDLDLVFFTENVLKENRMWIDFVNTTGRLTLDSLLQVAIGQWSASDDIWNLLLKEGLSLSLHLQGKENLVPLFYLPYGNHGSDHDFEQMLTGFLDQVGMMNDRKYEGTNLYDVSGKPGFVPGRFTFACSNGLWMVSPSSLLVEEAIRTLHSDVNLSGDKDLELVRKTAGRYVHANVYLNYSKLPDLFHPLLSDAKMRDVSVLARLAQWGELDLDVKEDALLFNGMTRATSEDNDFLDLFKSQSPVKMEIHQIMPAGATSFLHMGISDKGVFLDRFASYLASSESWAGTRKGMEALKKDYGVDLLEGLVSVMDDEVAWIALEGITREKNEEVLILETKSRSETRELMLGWLEAYLQKNAFDMDSYRTVYQLDKQTSFPIYTLPEPFLVAGGSGRLLNRHFTFYENCLLFGPSVDVLSRVIYQNVLHKTFVSDPVHKEISEYLANRSNITQFIRPYPYLEYLGSGINESARKPLADTELFLRRIPGVVIQYSAEDELFYQSVAFRYTSQIKEKALTVWESLLDSAVTMKPVLVQNHVTGEKEIFVQDASNKIYLINSTGRVVWSQFVDGPILGEVNQVDFFKNGKLQYLFNTKEQMHLIDRNGNYVERYPVKFRVGATSPLALFDYDKSRNYRIFVAGEDRQIYCYDIAGKLIPGWKFGKTESVVNAAPQHFRVQTRDFILVHDQTRVYVLDRQGKERVKPRQRLVVSHNNGFQLDMNIREERPRWITTDTAGNISCIYLDGTVSILGQQKLGPAHHFLMDDLDRDGIPEFILADGKDLWVRTQDGKTLFSFSVRDGIQTPPDVYKFSSSDIKIGITDNNRNRIYLVNSDGSLYEGFPLEGSTRFSIGYFAGSDSRFNLIVGSANNFLYNYSIE